jgi:hypothetical protein
VKLPFIFQNSQVKSETKTSMKSVKEIEILMRNYFVIAIHLRLGDKYMINAPKRDLKSNFRRLAAFKCASSLDAYYRNGVYAESENKDGSNTILKTEKKPVMWFVSADSYELRQQALELFPDRVAILDIKPKHVEISFNATVATPEKQQEQKQFTAETMAEWYLLGLANELVQTGSGYVRLSWLANLNNNIYNDADCTQSIMDYKHTNLLYFPKTTHCSSIAEKQSGSIAQQRHLHQISRSGLAFPTGWVDYRTSNLTTKQFFHT